MKYYKYTGQMNIKWFVKTDGIHIWDWIGSKNEFWQLIEEPWNKEWLNMNGHSVFEEISEEDIFLELL